MQGVDASILIIFYTVMLTISWLFIHVLLFKVKNEWVIQRFNITQLQSGTVYPLRFFGASGRMGKKGTVTDKLERPFCYGQLGTSKKLFDPCDISRGHQQQELFAFYIEWQCPALVKEGGGSLTHQPCLRPTSTWRSPSSGSTGPSSRWQRGRRPRAQGSRLFYISIISGRL